MKYLALAVLLFACGAGLTQLRVEDGQTYVPVVRTRTTEGLFLTLLHETVKDRRVCQQTVERVAGLLRATAAFATGTVTSVKGSVRIGNQPVTENQQIPIGSLVTTGPDAQLVLRFEDGQRVVLSQNTELRIVDYRFAEANPQTDRM